MLDAAIYLDALHRDAAALAGAARRAGMDAPIPSCPGWTMDVLLTHLTGIYAHRIAIVGKRATENIVTSYDDLDLPPAYREWFDREFDEGDKAQEKRDFPTPPGLVDLFERTAARLEETLRAAGPDQPAWTWWPDDQTAGFWLRRMTHETAVHRWDAQLALGAEATTAIEPPDLARDGCDEVFDVMMPSQRTWAEMGEATPARPGGGESYHFHQTDGAGEWLVRFGADGPVVTREHARADVAVRGTGSDLLLFLWHRVPADRFEVFGDRALLDRLFELFPPD